MTNCSVVRWIKILFGNNVHCVLQTKEETDHPACCQQTVQKPASLMGWGCIRVYGVGSFHIWKGTINVEEHIEALEQHMLPSRQCLRQWPCIFQQDNAKPHTLHPSQQHYLAGEETRCWTGLSAVQTFHQQKTFGTSQNKRHSSPKTPATGLLTSQTFKDSC